MSWPEDRQYALVSELAHSYREYPDDRYDGFDDGQKPVSSTWCADQTLLHVQIFHHRSVWKTSAYWQLNQDCCPVPQENSGGV